MCSASAEFEDFVLQFMDRYVEFWQVIHQQQLLAVTRLCWQWHYRSIIGHTNLIENSLARLPLDRPTTSHGNKTCDVALSGRKCKQTTVLRDELCWCSMNVCEQTCLDIFLTKWLKWREKKFWNLSSSNLSKSTITGSSFITIAFSQYLSEMMSYKIYELKVFLLPAQMLCTDRQQHSGTNTRRNRNRENDSFGEPGRARLVFHLQHHPHTVLLGHFQG